jgi:hypothetical protein
MDIITQIVLNYSVYFLGFAVLRPLHNTISNSYYIGMSWFVGWFCIVTIELLLIVSQINITSLRLFSIMLFLASITLFIYFKKIHYRLNLFFSDFKSIEFCILLFSSMVAIILIANYGNYSFYSSDSIQIEGISRTFHKYGLFGNGLAIYGPNEPLVTHPLFLGRTPFYISIQNIAYLFGVDIYYSFTPLTMFFVVIAFYDYLKISNTKKYLQFSSFLLFILVLLSNRLLQLHVFYNHTNLITMAYYTMGILSLFNYLRYKRYIWLYIGFIILAITGIIRIEMLVYSLIPIFFIFMIHHEINLRAKFYGASLFILLSYIWYLWGFLILDAGQANENFGEGGLFQIIACLLFSIIVYFFPFYKLLGSIKYSFVYMLLLVFIMLFSYSIEKTMLSMNTLYSLTGLGFGKWGLFWWITFFAMLIFYFKYYVVKLNPPKDEILYISFIVVTFLVGRIVLYTLATVPSVPYWYLSANRTLLHVYPIGLFFIFKIINSSIEELMNIEEKIIIK